MMGNSIERNGKLLADHLRNEILGGQLLPGDRLAQEELASRFGVSRMPVREALRQLQDEGLVTIVRHSGAWVTPLNPADFEVHYKLRAAVEPLALAESVPRLTDVQIQRIVDLQAEMVALSSAELDVENFLLLDSEFHLATYAGNTNPNLTSIVSRLWNHTQRYRRAYVSEFSPMHLQLTNAEHFVIAQSIRLRNADAAASALALHINRTRESLSHMEVFERLQGMRT